MNDYRNQVIYLAGPYTHKDPYIMEDRAHLLTFVSALLIEQGIPNISPITQSHLQAKMLDLGTTWDNWKNIDIPLIEASDQVWVLTLPGWDKSVGVTAEIKHAKATGRQVAYLDLYNNKLILRYHNQNTGKEVKHTMHFEHQLERGIRHG